MSVNPMVVPESERHRGLRDFLVEYVGIIAELRDKNPQLAQRPQLFLFLIYPCLVDESWATSEQKEILEHQKNESVALKFDGAVAKTQLKEILASDKHLAACCPTLLHLASHFDLSFITRVADAKRQGKKKKLLDFAYDDFGEIGGQTDGVHPSVLQFSAAAKAARSGER